MLTTRVRAIALLAALLFVSACQTDQQEAEKFNRADAETFRRDMSALTSFTLSNGVTFYVQEERTDTRVAIEVFYRAGFTSEPKGKPQMSHLAEHLAIYCSMGDFGPDGALKAVQADRGMMNAEAVADFVHIDYVVEGARLEQIFKIESDRLKGTRCDQPTLEREAQKVISELDGVVKDPKGVLTRFSLMAFNQTYRFGESYVPVRSNTNTYTIEEARRFQEAHYRPDDMIVVVVGNIKTADVQALARTYFESVPRHAGDPIAKPVPAKNTKATWDVDAEVLFFYSPGPFANDRERLILTMFGGYLHQSMNTTAEVYSACRTLYCSNHVYRVDNLPFFIFAEPGDDYSNAQVASLLLAQLDASLANLDDAMMVDSIKGNIISFVTASMLKPDVPDYPLAHHQVIGQEALNIGMKHLVREGRSLDEFTAEVNSITAEEVRTVCRKYLARERLIQVTYGPRK